MSPIPSWCTGERQLCLAVGAKSSTRSNSGTSTCLGVSPPRKTFVGAGHYLDRETTQIGVQIAGRQENRLARGQRDAVSNKAASTPASPG